MANNNIHELALQINKIVTDALHAAELENKQECVCKDPLNLIDGHHETFRQQISLVMLMRMAGATKDYIGASFTLWAMLYEFLLEQNFPIEENMVLLREHMEKKLDLVVYGAPDKEEDSPDATGLSVH